MAFTKAARPRHCVDGAEARTLDEIADRVGVVARSSSRPPQGRAGNGTRCLACGSTLHPKRTSRRQRYCSYRCRDEARRARNFAASGATRRGSPAIPRTVKNRPLTSISCEGGFAGRTPSIIGPRVVIATEIIAGRIWEWEVSPDGVWSEVARVRRGGR